MQYTVSQVDVDRVQEAIIDGLRLDKPELAPPEVYDVMNSCWKDEPDRRPTFTDLHSRMATIYERDRQGLVLTPTLPPQPRAAFTYGGSTSSGLGFGLGSNFGSIGSNSMMTNQVYFQPSEDQPQQPPKRGSGTMQSFRGYLQLQQPPYVASPRPEDKQGYLIPSPTPLPQTQAGTVQMHRQFSLTPTKV